MTPGAANSNAGAPSPAAASPRDAPLRGGRVVIVGGGIIGASVAHHLARRGYRDVVVLERALVGEGSTARAAGGIRTQFSSRVNVELAQGSIGFWESFAERTGSPLDFRRHGYLLLACDERQVGEFAASVALQRSLGVDVRWLDGAESGEVFPGLRVDDVLAATYTPGDGSASPADAVAGFARSARAGGAQIRQHTEFLGLCRDGDGAVSGVRTAAGVIEAEAVLIATGPGARETGRRCGVELPVDAKSRQAFSATRTGLDGRLPLTVDMATGAYLHTQADGAAVVGGSDRDVPASERAQVDWSRAEPLAAAIIHRFPGLADMELARGWAGLREMTPDDLAIVGPIAQTPGLWAAVGFSGHGFMQSPMLGQALSEWLIDGQASIDLAALRPERFADPSAIVAETAVF